MYLCGASLACRPLVQQVVSSSLVQVRLNFRPSNLKYDIRSLTRPSLHPSLSMPLCPIVCMSSSYSPLRLFIGGHSSLPCPGRLPFPLPWPPALAARSASVLIHINELLAT